MTKINENYKKWACSLSGCNGGNIKADTWICGIEWGGGYTDYQKDLTVDINQGKIDNPSDKYDWNVQNTYTYGRSFAKLYTAIHNVSDDYNIENYQNYIENLEGNEVFKLNLYPVSFKDTNYKLWHQHNLDEITGFKNKYLYQLWFFFNRFPKFAELRKEHKPKLIICTGVDYLVDFLMCFGATENIDNIQVGTIKGNSDKNKYERTYYHIKIDKTLLVVVPFFSGSYGLNSYYLLNEMGKAIKNLLNNN
jgi:hypothetical protein